jgi:hypothetical protein
MRMVGFRVIVLPGKEQTMTRLCTNLPRTPFSLASIASAFRDGMAFFACQRTTL